MSALAENAASVVRSQYPEARGVPIAVERLAEKLGVSSISYTNLIEDGRLETDGFTTQILVRASANAARRRFTVAHELAHLLLTRPGQAAVERRLATDNEVERFCDQFAAALLLPRDWVIERCQGRPETLQSIRDLAAATETSLAASLVRLQQTLGWTSMLLQWRANAGSWQFRWAAGVPHALHGRIRATADTRRVFDEIRNKTTQDVAVELPLEVRAETARWPAIVSCKHSSVLALVQRPPTPRSSHQLRHAPEPRLHEL